MTTTTTKYKRRTFKDVAAAAHSKGYAEGREAARKEVQEEYDALVETNLEMGRHILSLEVELRSMSLRKLAWSRIKGLFGAGHDRVA
jgi:hypothetical protein